MQTKRHQLLKCSILLLLLMGMQATALAHDDVSKTKKKKKHWKGSISFGYISNSGNTSNDSFLTQLGVKYKRNKWENTFNASKQKVVSDSTTTTDTYSATYNTKYLLAPKRFLFGNADYTYDKFGAYTDVANLQVGYGWRLIKTKRTSLNLSIGPGYQYNRSAPDDNDNVTYQRLVTANGTAEFDWKISKNATFTQQANTTMDKENKYYSATSELQTNIVGNLGADISYTIEHNTSVPRGRKNTDTTTNIGLVYTF